MGTIVVGTTRGRELIARERRGKWERAKKQGCTSTTTLLVSQAQQRLHSAQAARETRCKLVASWRGGDRDRGVDKGEGGGEKERGGGGD